MVLSIKFNIQFVSTFLHISIFLNFFLLWFKLIILVRPMTELITK